MNAPDVVKMKEGSTACLGYVCIHGNCLVESGAQVPD